MSVQWRGGGIGCAGDGMWGRDVAILNKIAGECLPDEVTLEERAERGSQSCAYLGGRTFPASSW